MATCKLVLDTRHIDKKGEHNLAVEVNWGKNKCFLNITKMSKELYNDVLIKKSTNKDYTKFRNDCQKRVNRAEEIVNEMQTFDRQLLKDRFFNKGQPETAEESITVISLFNRYIEERSHLALGTIQKMRNSRNAFTTDNKELSIAEINKQFLEKFQRTKLKNGNSNNYVAGIFRDLRTVINYFSNNGKIPTDYKYPFGGDGLKICNTFPKKQVLDAVELQTFLNYSDFENKGEEYARDIWEILYLCNGINFADLFRLRWDQKKGDHFVFYRKKTENTRKNHKKEIVVPMSDRLQLLLDKVGNTASPFVLGKLVDDYKDQYFANKIHKYRGKINKNLVIISKKLNLPIEMNLSKARDCYATTLNRNDTPINIISEMLGHSNSTVTQHYLASMDLETTFKTNSVLLHGGN
ncbi:tyrosine-type recombinase/integrase [Kaistella antarctica]|uniref:Site-specific tyrosine recombinase XerD n=1 Tax=Kaistella antarctica TaxID=266748 RepID=A0A3S4UP24_9FLAO|nr:tyrosine-type recombinase/integrase [Kaistella antarctica]KEY20343.1 hypothetical protein HY04_03840 [Kaistella antarctica]SEV90778.1 Site-specific recombinase XerD [Kaistella antarctica]VEI01527.1 site-specific tyrosine recombinase XerD [Kaistella antarctica]